jgi:hypothetical protein
MKNKRFFARLYVLIFGILLIYIFFNFIIYTSTIVKISFPLIYLVIFGGLFSSIFSNKKSKNYNKEPKAFIKSNQSNKPSISLEKLEAVRDLKESKELRDLDIISKEEYKNLVEKYKPTLLNKSEKKYLEKSAINDFKIKSNQSNEPSISPINEKDKTKKQVNPALKALGFLILMFCIGGGVALIGKVFDKKPDLIGKYYRINDSFHYVNFESSNTYKIYQGTSAGPSCVGFGNWSYKNGKITLTQNDSRCEITNEIYGKFRIDDSGKWLE